MSVYVVMEPGDLAPDLAQEKALLVRDGFSFGAFLFPPLWLLTRRLWLEAAAAVLFLLAAGVLAAWLSGHEGLAPVLSILIGLYFGLEGSALQLAALRRRGFRDWGVVEARDRRDAELRYAAEADDYDIRIAHPQPVVTSSPSHTRQTSADVGLVSYPWAP